jgi:hypothetical protein
MDGIKSIVKGIVMLGFGGTLVLLIFIYAAYVIETHCWAPLGCIDPEQVKYQNEQDAIMRSWRHGY